MTTQCIFLLCVVLSFWLDKDKPDFRYILIAYWVDLVFETANIMMYCKIGEHFIIGYSKWVFVPFLMKLILMVTLTVDVIVGTKSTKFTFVFCILPILFLLNTVFC